SQVLIGIPDAFEAPGHHHVGGKECPHIWRQDADYRISFAVESNRSAHHIRIGAELALPITIGKDNDIMSIDVFTRQKGTPEVGFDAEETSEVGADAKPGDLLWLGPTGDRTAAVLEQEHVFK